MKDLRSFDIEISTLKPKRYEYEFDIDASFFNFFERSPVQNGKFKVMMTLDKSETMIQLKFHITGSAELACDRTSELFDYPIDVTNRLILKFGEENEELSDEIEIISRGAQQINVAQYIYEFIGLAIPMKKIHPRLAGEKYEENEEGILVYRSLSDSDSEETDDDPDSGEDVDPRWQILKNLPKN
jgi:uncharacterized metal-binding protein YceD (DUF177 family)